MPNHRFAAACVGLVLTWMLSGWPSAVYADEVPDAFVGTWRVTVTPDSATQQAGGKEFADALVFDVGALLTENFAYLGFEGGAYAVPAEEPLKFSATMASGSKGTLTWSGDISGSAIRGQLVWTKLDGVVWTYGFSGTK